MRHALRHRGFTLAELLIVIIITGIIAGMSMGFLKPAMDSYTDSKRRARLTDIADTALRTMGRDLRAAVPNSVRMPTTQAAGTQCLEMVPTSTGGRFRAAADTVNDVSCSGSGAAYTCSAPLDVTQPVTTFDVLSTLSATPSAGDWVVIANQHPDDVYTGANRAAISAAPTTLNDYRGSVRLQIASTQFSPGYDGGRFVVVPNNGGSPAVYYVCTGLGIDSAGNGTGTLYRVPAAFGSMPASCPTSGGAVLATKVQSCTFTYDANHGATQQSGFVWMQLQLTEANESASLAYGTHVDNVP